MIDRTVEPREIISPGGFHVTAVLLYVQRKLTAITDRVRVRITHIHTLQLLFYSIILIITKI